MAGKRKENCGENRPAANFAPKWLLPLYGTVPAQENGDSDGRVPVSEGEGFCSNEASSRFSRKPSDVHGRRQASYSSWTCLGEGPEVQLPATFPAC